MSVTPSDLGDRLQISCLPPIKLTSEGAYDALVRVADGANLVLIDSLRAACIGVDENDARIREYLDLLTLVSEHTGAAFIVIHHAGKSERSDARQSARGSSAIFDAADCVLQFDAKPGTRTVAVTQTKQPATADGDRMEPLVIEIKDTPPLRLPSGIPAPWSGVQIVATRDDDTPAERGRRKLADRDSRIMSVLTDVPISANNIHEMVGGQRGGVLERLRDLSTLGRINRTSGPRGADMYSVCPKS